MEELTALEIKSLVENDPHEAANVLNSHSEDQITICEYLKALESMIMFDPSIQKNAIEVICNLIFYIDDEKAILNSLKTLCCMGIDISNILEDLLTTVEDKNIVVYICALIAGLESGLDCIQRTFIPIITDKVTNADTRLEYISSFLRILISSIYNKEDITKGISIFIGIKNLCINAFLESNTDSISNNIIVMSNDLTTLKNFENHLSSPNIPSGQTALQNKKGRKGNSLTEFLKIIKQDLFASKNAYLNYIKAYYGDNKGTISSNPSGQLKSKDISNIADFLMEFGTKEDRLEGMKIIVNLSSETDEENYQVYKDKESAHNTGVRASALINMKKLISIVKTSTELTKLYRTKYTYKKALGIIETSLPKTVKYTAIENTIRIITQNTVPIEGLGDIILSQLLRYLITYISESPAIIRKSLTLRLIEELVDANDTCTTGVEVRLINCLSGYGDFYLNIDPSETMRYIIQKEINKRITEIEDEELKDEIILGTLVNSETRELYLEFVRSIKDDIYEVVKLNSKFLTIEKSEDYIKRTYNKIYGSMFM